MVAGPIMNKRKARSVPTKGPLSPVPFFCKLPKLKAQTTNKTILKNTNVHLMNAPIDVPFPITNAIQRYIQGDTQESVDEEDTAK